MCSVGTRKRICRFGRWIRACRWYSIPGYMAVRARNCKHGEKTNICKKEKCEEVCEGIRKLFVLFTCFPDLVFVQILNDERTTMNYSKPD
jgi:hypothetical protein